MFTMENWPEKPKRKQRVHIITNLYELHHGAQKVDKAREKLLSKRAELIIGGFAVIFWTVVIYKIIIGLCQ